MNRKQRVRLTVGFLLLVVAALFPPWRYSDGSPGFGLPRLPGLSGSRSYSSSYGFLFNPPFGSATIELSRLAVEWALIALLTSGLFFWFRKSSGTETESQRDQIVTTRTKRQLLVSGVSVLAICLVGLSYYLVAKKIVRDLPPSEVAKVTGPAYITNYGSIELNAYNGSELVLTEVTVSISVLDATRNAVISNRAYRLFPSYKLNPQSSAMFSANLGFTLERDQTWYFTIVGAKGRRE